MKMIVGLGNPGKEYENTRHNIGFMVLNYFPGNNFTKEKYNGLIFEDNINGEKVIFVKPTTYMNLSGECVGKLANFYKIDHNDILIIQDDLDLPYMKYRLKYKSSSGGHNGLKSIMNCLGTDEIPRLKIGIANNKQIDTKDYVLGKFSKEQLDLFDSTAKIFKDIIIDFINKDINYCMMKYNKK